MKTVGNIGLAHDRRAIDQRAGMDQHAIDQQGVIGRHQQVARRNVFAKRAGLDADRQHADRIGEERRNALPAEPAHRPGVAVGGQDQIAGLQRLDRDFAVGRGITVPGMKQIVIASVEPLSVTLRSAIDVPAATVEALARCAVGDRERIAADRP